MTRQQQADNLLHIWQLQRDVGLKPDQRRLPTEAEFESDLEVLRKCMERA